MTVGTCFPAEGEADNIGCAGTVEGYVRRIKAA